MNQQIDNNHFGSGLEIERHFNGVKIPATYDGNTFKKDIRAGHVYFDIALKHGGFPLKQQATAVRDEDLVD